MHAVKALHQCVLLVADAAAQARDAGWLALTLELLPAAPPGDSTLTVCMSTSCSLPAVAVEAAYACARLAADDVTNRLGLSYNRISVVF